jgi:Glutaminase
MYHCVPLHHYLSAPVILLQLKQIDCMKRIYRSLLFLPVAVLLLVASCSRNSEYAVTLKENVRNGMRLNAAESNGLVTTVAAIIPTETGVTYNFNEKEAPFAVASTHPEYDKMLQVAREAQAKGLPVKMFFEGSNLLTSLLWPSDAETKSYIDWYRGNLVLPEPSRIIDMSRLDPSFNKANWQNWKPFYLCTKIMPGYATAQTIFNYCAAQGCYLGPTQVQPCIPFEYVKNGCFARAHKMRQIITTQYGYCCEKVFSYGDLNVKADKWGGCCVSWWYHVAPLVRVKVNNIVYCYVIDPGMFDKPVLLSEWLGAQANKTCSSGAGVTSYSIQPGSAYTPAGGGSSYTTDANYAITNADLQIYNAAGNTCD